MDSDLDTMPDDWEIEWGLDPLDPADAAADDDGDEVPAWTEHAHGASPNSADTDGDGFDDGTEIALGSDPADPDSVPDIEAGDVAEDAPDTGADTEDGGLGTPIIILMTAFGGILLAAGALWLRKR